jgi:riboflavin kinase/FMN adenylyltransferase
VSTVVTIGNFDGVHRGHQVLVQRATTEAARRGARCIAVTFDPHPAAVLRPDAVPPALQSLEERVALLRGLGCDDAEVVTFDAGLAAMSPERFVEALLVQQLEADVVVVGENFRFGQHAAGDVTRLRELGERFGFTVVPVGLVELGDRPVSSSALRALLATGDVEAVAVGLGRTFSLTGEIVPGDGRGRTIGIPTANVKIGPERALPADGVYACWATKDGRSDPAVVNVGWRPTFDGTARTVEAHLIVEDSPDLYGHRVTLAFVARIRGEERFTDAQALVARIRLDVAAATDILAAVRSPETA